MHLELQFHEHGGYDGMTGAWSIVQIGGEPGMRSFKTLVLVDQDDYGQEHCDYDFRSEEAKRVAQVCFDALKDQGFLFKETT